jgi:uncharacterized damage-inducible protein DinB
MAAAEEMDAADFLKRKPGAFSVRDLLVHLMDAEDYWVGSVILGGGHHKFTPEKYGDPQTLRADWDEVRDRTGKMFATLSEEMLGETRTVQWENEVTFDVNRALWHLLLHQIHHFGQACMLIREYGYEPPVVDLL